jgi:hypothetical protein
MNGNFSRGRVLLLMAGLVMLTNVAGSAAEVDVVRTNWTDRWITNVIDVRMPMNVFVNEFHTNWVEQVRTNIVNRYATNVATRTLTNTVVVNGVQTNFVKAYRTNWNTLTLTNQVAVDLLQTNVIERYQTNWNTLTLTNWKTILVMKTNWVTQPVTNVVQIDLSSRGQLAAAAPERAAPRQLSQTPQAQTPPTSQDKDAPLPPAPISNDISLEASRSARPVINNAVEVQLKVRWTGGVATTLLVQHWRVESEDGTILVQAQEREFKRDLPFGRYKVEVRVRREANGPLLAARGTLAVTARDAYVLQKLAAN